MVERAKARLHEQETGEYDFRQMLKQSESTPPLIDCATFSAGVEVRESPGRGRGLFLTKRVLAGELLICEKAFAYAYVDEKDASNYDMTNVSVIPSDVELLLEIVQKLYHDPEAALLFNDLPHGDYKVVSGTKVDGYPVVDKSVIGCSPDQFATY
jgi:hypothetical protein